MSYNYIFPTCIWSDEQLDLSKQILPIAKHYLEVYGDVFQTNVNHISTYRNMKAAETMQKDIMFKPLIKYLRKTSEDYIKTQNVFFNKHIESRLNSDDAYMFLINKITKSGTHPMHAHPASMLSGCFYLQCEEKDPPIIFGDPRSYFKYINYEQKIYNHLNPSTLCSDFTVPVKTGLILLWPSWLEHTVPASTSDSERITIAFNIG